MKGNSADDKHHETLRRIVALLLALAGLAERAACRSWPVRRIVLWLLRPAERAARTFAAQAGCAASPPIRIMRQNKEMARNTDSSGSGSAPDDGPGGAARLARQFRALAATFAALLHQAPASLCFARRPDPDRRCRGRPNAAWLYRLLPAFQPRRADTS